MRPLGGPDQAPSEGARRQRRDVRRANDLHDSTKPPVLPGTKIDKYAIGATLDATLSSQTVPALLTGGGKFSRVIPSPLNDDERCRIVFPKPGVYVVMVNVTGSNTMSYGLETLNVAGGDLDAELAFLDHGVTLIGDTPSGSLRVEKKDTGSGVVHTTTADDFLDFTIDGSWTPSEGAPDPTVLGSLRVIRYA